MVVAFVEIETDGNDMHQSAARRRDLEHQTNFKLTVYPRSYSINIMAITKCTSFAV